MKGPVYRVYRDGFPHHVYSKGIDGNIVFYATEDCIFYLTLFSCLARKYRMTVRGFTIMPNHTHSDEEAKNEKSFRAFHDELNSKFTVGYNRRHNRQGPLLKAPFGFAAKTVGKKIRDNLCYIANNPVVGRLTLDVMSYRWSLIPYFNNDHPFSEKIVLSRSSRALRRAVKMVNYFRSRELPLDYLRQELIMGSLNAGERKQITDRIISQYNCLDFAAMSAFYGGSFLRAVETFRANSGSEHDIPEDYENYGCYAQMIRLAEKIGFDLSRWNPAKEDPRDVNKLVNCFREYGFPSRQIDRFLQKAVADK